MFLMKKIKNNRSSGGFWLSFALNLASRTELLVLALFALAAYFVFGLTIWVFIALLIGWLFISLFITTVLTFIASGIYEEDIRPNKNPYSVKNQDYTQSKNKKEENKDGR